MTIFSSAFCFTSKDPISSTHLPQVQSTIINDPSHSTLVLCDGIHATPYSQLAAQIVSKLVAETIHTKFYLLLYTESNSAKREMTQIITQALQTQASQLGIAPSVLTCTIIGASMDCTGNYLCFHLGNGILFQRLNSSSKLRTLSGPEEKLLPGSTVCTMQSPLFSHLRFYRATQSHTQRLILLTGGAPSLLRNSLAAEQTLAHALASKRLSTLQHYLRLRHPTGIFGCGIIERSPLSHSQK